MSASVLDRPPEDTITAGIVRRWTSSTFGGFPRVFWVLFAGSGLARLGFFVVPFLAYYCAHARHLSPGQITVVMTCFGAGWTAAGPIGGWLADRYGRRVPLVVGACGAAAAYLALAHARHSAAIAVCALAAGVFFDLYRPAVAAIIADRVPQHRRQQAFGLWYIGVINAAGAVGTVLGGVFANHGFGILFAADAAANLFLAAAILHWVPASPPSTEHHHPRWRTALADRRLLGFTMVSLAAMTVYAQSVVTLPFAFARAGIGPLGYGLICAANPIAVVLLQPLLQPLIERRNPAVLCAIGAATIGGGIALTGSGHTMAWYASTTVIWTLGEALLMTGGPAIVTTLAPDGLAAIYAGVWQTAMGGALLLAPVAGGIVLTAGGPGLLWTVCAVTGVLAAAGCLAARPIGHREQVTTT